jgi:lysophospholipase L1-like esterase
VRAVLLGFVFALIGVEALLQLASFVLWVGKDGATRPPGRVILCLGDSLTFGLGAEPQQAYPPQLESALRRGGAAWSVVNAGVAGQNSADVLMRLSGLLTQYEPSVLCLLVGWNDMWSRPKQLVREQLPSQCGFPLRWRTGRLIDLAFARWRVPKSADEARMPFLGEWRIRGQSMKFSADGTAQLGSLNATWTLAGENLQITPQGGAPLLVRWRESEGGIDFALMGWDRFYRARRGAPMSTDSPAEFDEALELGAIDKAAAIVGAARGAAAETAMQADLCLALLRAGRRQEAVDRMRWVEAAWQQRREPVAGEGLARWQRESGDDAAALLIAEAVVAVANERTWCWRVLVDCGPAAGRRALAERIRQAAGEQVSTWRRAELTAELAVLTATWDADAATAFLLVARDLGIGPDETIACVHRAVALGADPTRLLAATRRANVASTVRDALERDVRRATVSDSEMITVLSEHVRLAIDLCRERGTEPVLLGYPFAMPAHEEAMKRIATSARVPFVTMVGAFAAKQAGSPRGDWFADEIHCTARGYELMAGLVADRIAALGR